MENRRAILYEDFNEFRRSLSDETDRGCALMAAAYLDEALKTLFREVLVQDNKIVNELFSTTGPIGTFSSRIDLAYVMGLIGKRFHRDLHLIRKIRNDFGHTAKKIDFTTASIKARCQELYNDGYERDAEPRRKFERCASGLVGQIHVQILTATQIKIKEDIPIEKLKETHKRIQEQMAHQVAIFLREAEIPSADTGKLFEEGSLPQARIRESISRVKDMLREMEESLSSENTEAKQEE